MHICILLRVLLSIPVSLGWNEDFQVVCSGQEFRLPVYSGSRIVTFTPSYPPGPRRVLLENNNLKDPRFEWTKDRTLLLKDVTHSDQGLYSIKLSSGFTDETVRLTVSECIKTFRRGYGETFQHNIPKDGSLLEFSPQGSPPDSQPVVLWNRTDLETSEAGRGRLGSDGRVWVAERVTQADQGNYTIRDENGKVISRSKLAVNDKTARWRAVLKSISVPSGMFVTLAGFILFMKRYPNCSLTMIINGLRGHHTTAANPPRVNVQDYSPPSPQPYGFYGHSQQIGTPKIWSPRPTHSGYTPVVDNAPLVEDSAPQPSTEPVRTGRQQETDRLRVETATTQTFSREETAGSERVISFSVAGASDCLHSSEDCFQFRIKKEGVEERWKKAEDYFSTLPLDTDTSETCSIYTSDKLNFL